MLMLRNESQVKQKFFIIGTKYLDQYCLLQAKLNICVSCVPYKFYLAKW